MSNSEIPNPSEGDDTPDDDGKKERYLRVREGLLTQLAFAQEQLEAATLRDGETPQDSGLKHERERSDTEYWQKKVLKITKQLKLP